MADEKNPGDELEPGAAAETVVSLSQILLAPLDAIFKAQVHAGRSFLNFLLQLSYDYKPEPSRESSALGAAGVPSVPKRPDTIHSVDFVQEVPGPLVDGKTTGPPRLQKVSVPALALVPLRPLSIQEAEVALAMEVTFIGEHRQTRKAERDKASADTAASGSKPEHPWYLVDHPISLRGHVASDTDKTAGDRPMIRVSMKLGVVPTPSGLDKLLTTLTQSANVADIDPNDNSSKDNQ